jgi:acetolactate synthase I/II/III large subunit
MNEIEQVPATSIDDESDATEAPTEEPTGTEQPTATEAIEATFEPETTPLATTASEAAEPGSADSERAAAELEHAPAAEAVESITAERTDSAEPAESTQPDMEAAAAEPEPAAPAGPVTVGRMIADALRKAGVRWAFTVPGESFLGLLDGLNAGGINVVATRHEGAAAFMAEAHAQLTGRPAAALGTRAVGASNLAIGIHAAYADSSPMFVLVGQVEGASRGHEGFQEVDLAGSIGRLAKWAAEPTAVASVVEAVGEAINQATTGRPGPVLLGLSEDLLDEMVPAGTAPTLARAPQAKATDDEIRAVLHLLADAKRPVIFAGAGVLRARTSNDLLRLAELLRVPVIASWRRGDVISNDHPLYLGMAGYGSPPTVRERLEAADAMLVIGNRLNEISSFGWKIPTDGTRWAHVDLVTDRPHEDLRPADIRITADARLFLRAAVSHLESHGVLEKASTDDRTAANEADRAAWEAATVIDAHPWSGPGIHPGRVVTTLRRVLPDDAILTTDAGSFGTWAARGFRFRRPGTFLGSTSGAMGYGLPAAIAAGLVHRDRTVVALCGDGGLGMTLAEIETAVRSGLRTVILVFDNERYGMIRTYQERRPDGAGVGTDLGPIDFAAVARALGARGVRVEDDAGFEPALRQAIVADRPTLIHLVLDRRWEGVDSRP